MNVQSPLSSPVRESRTIVPGNKRDDLRKVASVKSLATALDEVGDGGSSKKKSKGDKRNDLMKKQKSLRSTTSKKEKEPSTHKKKKRSKSIGHTSSTEKSSSKAKDEEAAAAAERVRRLEAELHAIKQQLILQNAPEKVRQRSWRDLFSNQGRSSRNLQQEETDDKKPKRGFLRKLFGGKGNVNDENKGDDKSVVMEKSKSTRSLKVEEHDEKPKEETVSRKAESKKESKQESKKDSKAKHSKEKDEQQPVKKKYARKRLSMQLGSTPSGEMEPPICSTPVETEPETEEGEETEFSVADNTDTIVQETVAIEQSPKSKSTKKTKKSKKAKKRKSLSEKSVASRHTEKTASSSSCDSKPKSEPQLATTNHSAHSVRVSNKQKRSTLQTSICPEKGAFCDPLDFAYPEYDPDDTGRYAEEDVSESCFSLSEHSPHVWCQPSDQAAFVELDIRRLDGELEKRLTFNS